MLTSPDLRTEALTQNITTKISIDDQLQPSTPQSIHNNSPSPCSPRQRVPNVSQVSHSSSVWSWRESCKYHRNLTPPDAVSPSPLCRCISSTFPLCSSSYGFPQCFRLPLSPLYLHFPPHPISVVLYPFPPRPSGVLPLLEAHRLLPRLAAPIRHRSEKKAGAYLPINAPSHQTSTSPTIHRQQTSTSYRQPRNNSSIFRITNIRHGWRQGKIIRRQVVRRQGRSRWRKEATEPLEQGWSSG